MSSENICIWCSGPATDKDLEHIFPEALGCPAHLTLPGTVVCRRCNTGLAHLDQGVADEFDVLAWMNNIRRKRGRAPEISNRGNTFGNIGKHGPQISFNLERHAVTAHDGRRLAPYRGNLRDIRPKFERDGSIVKSSFEVPFGQGKKFVRGMTKIALGALAFLCGADLARRPQFDCVRQFVRFGGDKRYILVAKTEDGLFKLSAESHFMEPDGDYCIEARIANISFLIDLSHSQKFIPVVQAKALETHGTDGWTTLPTAG